MASSGSEALMAKRFPSVALALRAVAPAPTVTPIAHDLAVLWAQMQVKAPKADALYIVSGLGEHVTALLPRLDSSACLVVYEASLPTLKATLAAQDWSVVLSDERVHLFAGAVGPNEFERLHQLPIVRLGDVVPLRFSPVWGTNEKAYTDFFTEFARQFSVTRRLHLTNYNDSPFWQAMTLENLPYHYNAPDVKNLMGLFPELPVILVGAGPSLDDADEFLRAAADRAIIVAVNSSYRKVIKIGIKPHLVLAADPRADTFRGFEGQPTEGVYLVSPFIVNHGVVKAFQGHAFSWGGDNNPFVALLRQRLGLGEGTPILERGTVSACVADLAYLMGTKRLILVGQDMATKADGTTHVRESFYNDGVTNLRTTPLSQEELALKKMRLVPGNTIAQVPTLENLFVYLKTFEHWVETHPQIEVINTAHFGAKINGAAYKSYDQALAYLPNQPAHILERLHEAHRAAPEQKLSFEQWQAALNSISDFARKLYHTALTGATAVEALPERYWQPSYANQREVREIYAQADALNTLTDKYPLEYRLLLDGMLKRRLLELKQKYRTLEASNPMALELLQNKELFWALVEGIEPFLGLVKKQQAQVAQVG